MCYGRFYEFGAAWCYNWTALHIAAKPKGGLPHVVQLLLARGANPLAVDKNSRIPSDKARQYREDCGGRTLQDREEVAGSQ